MASILIEPFEGEGINLFSVQTRLERYGIEISHSSTNRNYIQIFYTGDLPPVAQEYLESLKKEKRAKKVSYTKT
ncbi:MAG: hypothetical protein V3U72_02140 [Candidatus Aenigmarchaeota archaeon]